MRMQREEKIVVVLLLMALGSLAVAEWAFSDLAQQASAKSSISHLSVEGLVLNIAQTKTGSNIVINLDSTTMPVFAARDCGADEIFSRVHAGDRVRVRGELSEFNGAREIKVHAPSDIEILS